MITNDNTPIEGNMLTGSGMGASPPPNNTMFDRGSPFLLITTDEQRKYVAKYGCIPPPLYPMASTVNVLPENGFGGVSPPSCELGGPGSPFLLITTDEQRKYVMEHGYIPQHLYPITQTDVYSSDISPGNSNSSPDSASNWMNTIKKNKGNDKDRTIDSLIEEIDNRNFLLNYKSDAYMLQGQIYIPFKKRTFRNFVYRFSVDKGINLSPQDANTIISYVDMHTKDYPGEPDEDTFTLFENGFVDNNTGILYDHIPNYFPTVCIKANYTPSAELSHPLFDAFLFKLCNGDPLLIQRMWEIIGYALSSDNKAKKFFLLIGESGNNGKSAWLDFLAELVSENSVNYISMSNLFDGRFSESELKMKRLNISPDEGQCKLKDDAIGRMKKLTSGNDKTTADVKNSDQITFKPACKFFLASNYDLTSSYAACGEPIVKRMCRVPFEAVISDDEKDPHIVEKLLTEKDAVVTEAFGHYLALKERNYVFTGSEEFDVEYVLPQGDCYSMVDDFCRNCCDFSDTEEFTFTEDLYTAFTQKYGYNVFSDSTGFSQCFKKVCETAGYKIEKKRQRTCDKNAWGYIGIKLV